MSEIRVDAHTVALSNTEKVFFPEAGVTKGDLIDYYRRIADCMLPHVQDRPLALHRYPDGIDAEGFVQQEAPGYFPDWIERVTVEKEGGTITHALANSAAALVYLANQGCVTPHTWLSRTGHLRRPDRLIFDLDPPADDSASDDVDFRPVCDAARAVRDLLTAIGCTPFVMTTGSRGLHVTCSLTPDADFEAARQLAHDVADVLADRHPDTLTAQQRKDQRKGRIFVDYLRNSYGQTSVPPYAVRARPGAPVATPLDWGELAGSDLSARRYTTRNLFRRLGQKDDPWAEMDAAAVSLEEPAQRLRELRNDA